MRKRSISTHKRVNNSNSIPKKRLSRTNILSPAKTYERKYPPIHQRTIFNHTGGWLYPYRQKTPHSEHWGGPHLQVKKGHTPKGANIHVKDKDGSGILEKAMVPVSIHSYESLWAYLVFPHA